MIKFMDKVVLWLNRILIFTAGVFLVAMVILTCANIIFRITWVPVRGTFELMGLFGAVRNPTAHAPKVTWPMTEQDALDVLSLVSFVHRKLDSATKL